ncbi:hypothetical protein Tco_1217869 [Tanacetum coccineum]
MVSIKCQDIVVAHGLICSQTMKSLGRLWFILVLPRNLAVERAWSENSHLVLGPAGKFSKQGTQKQSGEHEAKQDNISGLSKRDVSEKSVPVVLVSII